MSFSDKEITFTLSEWMPITQSRAITFENDDLFDPAKGGGNFTLYAYVDNKLYIDGKRGWYHQDENATDGGKSGKWYMLDDKNQIRTYYWPNSGSVDFFAYMPDQKYNTIKDNDGYASKETYVTIGSHSKENGMTFTCDLPAAVDDSPPTPEDNPGDSPADPGDDALTCVKNSEMQEFIYAYTPGEKKKTDPVKLEFKHPFALINFKLASGSYRMTIKSFAFESISLKGKFETGNSTGTGKWTPSPDSKGIYTAKIGKRVPNDVNYNSELSDGGFIVMPQSIAGVTLTMSYTRETETETGTCHFTFKDNDKWEPGYKYTYTIKFGDNNEEIYFNVEATKWNDGDGKHEYQQDIEVE